MATAHDHHAGDDNMPDTGDSGDTAAVDSSGGSDTATTGAEYGVCFDYAKTAAECDDMVDQTEQYMECEGLLDYYAGYGKACLGAAEEFYACVAELDCRTFNSEEGCEKEGLAVDAACFAGTGSSGGSESGTAG